LKSVFQIKIQLSRMKKRKNLYLSIENINFKFPSYENSKRF